MLRVLLVKIFLSYGGCWVREEMSAIRCLFACYAKTNTQVPRQKDGGFIRVRSPLL